MANIRIGSGVPPYTITSTNTFVLGAASQDGTVGRWICDIRAGGGTIAIVVKARGIGSAEATAFLAIPYTKRYLNGAVADDSKVSTTITSDSIIDIDSAGLEIALDVTYTSGTGTVIPVGLQG
jgi:hypothetical protein